MIATGLVFLLGALVATLLALLFIPFLWRNAQRLARRDYAATMPATMGEIRAEVDRVRAEAAMTVRRHEMLTRKARERVALERATVGRLTATNAEVAFLGEQRQGEANALRAQIDGLQQRIEALEEIRVGLEEDNAALREALTQAEADLRPLPAADLEGISSGEAESDGNRRTSAAVPEPEQARITAATSALLALARDYRRDRPARGTASAGGSPAGEDRHPEATNSDVAHLMEIAKAPAPTDPTERRLRNANVRERIAELASRFLPGNSAEPSPVGTVVSASGSPPEPKERTEPAPVTPRKTPAGSRPKRRRGSQRNRTQPTR